MGDPRLFVAVAVPPPAASALAAVVAPLRAAHPDLRWTRPADWHLTLAFLGPVPLGRRLRAQLAVAGVAARSSPCELAIDGRLARFGERVLWAGVSDRDGRLAAVAGAVRTALADLGFVVDDRAFRAHVTLARGRRGRRLPRAPHSIGPGAGVRWTATSIALMASRPDAGGGRYRTVATWPLHGAAGSVTSEHPFV